MTKTKMTLVWIAAFMIDVYIAEAAVNSDQYTDVVQERKALARAGELDHSQIELFARRLDDELVATFVTRSILCRESDNFEFVGAGPKFAKVPARVCRLFFFDRGPFGLIQIAER